MALWRSTHNTRPQSQALMRVKGTYNGDSEGEHPFQGYARWIAPQWIGETGTTFLPEVYHITYWKEDDPNEIFLRYTIAGLGPKDADRPALRADFSWEEEGKPHNKWFSEEELAQEIKRREKNGLEVPPEFTEALDWLRDPYRPRATRPEKGAIPNESCD